MPVPEVSILERVDCTLEHLAKETMRMASTEYRGLTISLCCSVPFTVKIINFVLFILCSHCIFSVKVLRVVDVEDPHVARVSR